MIPTPSMTARYRRRQLGIVVASLAVFLSLAAPVTHAQADAITFGASVGDCYVYGTAPSGAHLRIDVLDHNGVREARTHVVVNGSGDWDTGCLPHFRVRERDHFEAYQDGSLQRLWVLPRFSVSVDRVSDRARGEGPTNDDLMLNVQKCFPGGITCEDLLQQTVHTAANGAFDTELLDGGVTAWNAIGDQRVQLYWLSGLGDELFLHDSVPYLQASAGSSRVSGQGTVGVTQTITLRSAGGQIRGTATGTGSAYDGSWTATLRHNGSPVKVKPGDTLHGSFAPDASLKVSPIHAQVDLAANTLSGTCFPHALAGVRLRSPAGTSQEEAWGTTGSHGELDILNTSGLVNVDHGWTIDLYCATSHGDVLHRRQVVP